jgi:mono/diheme cytochrome c family protein
MNRNLGLALLLAVAVLAVAGSALHAADTAAAGKPDAKAVFLAQKCNLCHSISAASIDRTMKSSKAPDLSGVGASHDAAWIEKILTRKEKLNGKDHQKKFTGSDAELKAVAEWLAGMKKKA